MHMSSVPHSMLVKKKLLDLQITCSPHSSSFLFLHWMLLIRVGLLQTRAILILCHLKTVKLLWLSYSQALMKIYFAIHSLWNTQPFLSASVRFIHLQKGLHLHSSAEFLRVVNHYTESCHCLLWFCHGLFYQL